MKRICVLAVIVAAMVTTSCGTKKMLTEQSKGRNPFGEVFEAPCQVYDTSTNFAATGIAQGSMNRKGQIQSESLENAQSLVRQKMKHAYQGMISNYSNHVGNNRGTDIDAKMTAAGDHIIDVVVGNTSATCIKWSEIDERGYVECYTAIEIPKEELATKIASAVKDALTEEEKMRIGFEEEQYRRQMEQRFRDYKKEH